MFFGPLRGAFWAPAARPTWSLGTFCSGFPAPAPPNPDLTNLLDPPNLHTGFYLYLWAYEVHSRPAGSGPLAGRQGSSALGRNSNSRQLERVQVTIDSSLRPDWSSEGVCRPELETDRRGAANGTLLYVVPGGSFPDASGSFPDPP